MAPEYGASAMREVKDLCPVFQGRTAQAGEADGENANPNACPYSKVPNAKQMALDKCPAFNGAGAAAAAAAGASKADAAKAATCPFKECESIDQVREKLSQVPVSHRPGGSGPGQEARQAFTEVMAGIHQVSKRESAAVGACPTFAQSCPFKDVTPADDKDVPLMDPVLFGLRLRRTSSEESGPAQASVAAEEQTAVLPLSKALKERTKKVHREAENVEFVRAFIKGKVQRPVYRELLVKLFLVYKALEREWDALCESTSEIPAVTALRALWFPAVLNRTKTLEQDLEFFYGPEWRSLDAIKTPSPATLEYVARVEELAKNDPLLLLAHAYTRYLGDLSGGQTLKRVAIKAMELPVSGEGTTFYTFPAIESAKAFKNEYRSKMDGLALHEEEVDRLVEEAKLAFRLNIGLFYEMDNICGFQQPKPAAPKPEKAAPGCPFARLTSLANETLREDRAAAPPPGAVLPFPRDQLVILIALLAMAAAMFFPR